MVWAVCWSQWGANFEPQISDWASALLSIKMVMRRVVIIINIKTAEMMIIKMATRIITAINLVLVTDEMSSWECVHIMIFVIFVGMASIMIFDGFNDYGPTSMSMVMMLLREMVQNLKISLRGVHGTRVSFFRQSFRIILPPLNTWLCILMLMIVWGWPPGQSDLVLLSGRSISFLLISDSSKYTKLKSTDSNMCFIMITFAW